MHVEEIVISQLPSDPIKEQPRETRVCDIGLRQHNGIRFCKCSFELFNHHFLSVKIDKAFRRTREYELHIGILDPEPIRSLRISWLNLVAFSVLAGTAGLAGYTNFFPNSNILAVILGVCAGLFLILAVYHSQDRLVFYSQNGRTPLVTLFNRNPDQETLSTFITIFTDQIKEANTNLNFICGNERLNVELKEHRCLMEKGIISRKGYDISKSRILDSHQ